MRKFVIIFLIITLSILGLLKFANDNPKNPVVKKIRRTVKRTWADRFEYYDNAKSSVKDFFGNKNNEIISTGPNINITWQKLYNIGTTALQTEEYEIALDYFNQAILVDSGQSMYWNNKAITLNRLGMFDESIDCYNKVLSLEPNKDSAWISKWAIFFNKEEYWKAIESFSQALNINSGNWQIWNNKWIAEFSLKKYKDAVISFDQSIFLNSGHSDSWYYQWLSYELLWNLKSAIKSFSEASKLDKNNVEILYHLWITSYEYWDIETAFEAFKYANKLDPKHLGILKNLGKISYEAKDFYKAVYYFEKYLGKETEDWIVWAYLWNAYYGMNSFMNAYLSYKKAIKFGNRTNAVLNNKLKAEMQIK